MPIASVQYNVTVPRQLLATVSDSAHQPKIPKYHLHFHPTTTTSFSASLSTSLVLSTTLAGTATSLPFLLTSALTVRSSSSSVRAGPQLFPAGAVLAASSACISRHSLLTASAQPARWNSCRRWVWILIGSVSLRGRIGGRI